MKRNFCIVLCLALVLCCAGCGKTAVKTDLWADATYTEDAAFGRGAKTITFKVTAQEKTVTFTIKTDRDFLGEALLDCELIAGEDGKYGIYVDAVNGILADYKADHSYWAFNKGGEMLMVSVDKAEVKNGDTFEAVYTK